MTESAAHDEGGTLGLWDAVSLVVGIVVGTAIFRSSTMVFQNTTGPWAALGAWTLGGVLSLAGAFCYVELATAYPRAGGDYEYLTRAYGSWAGFLFGWAQLTLVFTSNVGAMAFAFGDYGVRLFDLPATAVVWLAVAAILAMTLLNAWTVRAGAWTQILLTAAKVVGLTAVVAAGAWRAGASSPPARGVAESIVAHPTAEAVSPNKPPPLSFGLAMVFVLYAYGGWNDAAFVAADVRDPRRNIPLALLGGVGLITVIYLAVNAAYLSVLGFEGARHSDAPAADVLQAAVGSIGAKFISALVMISALGAINGMILARSRMFATLGADHRALAWLSDGRREGRAPRRALAAQAVATLAAVLCVGTQAGQRALDALLHACRAPGVDWQHFGGGFEALVAATAPVFWVFFAAVGVAVVVLRVREPERPRPFPVPLYPLMPAVFVVTCLFMLRSSVTYAGWLAAAATAPLAAGLVLYAVTRKR